MVTAPKIKAAMLSVNLADLKASSQAKEVVGLIEAGWRVESATAVGPQVLYVLRLEEKVGLGG